MDVEATIRKYISQVVHMSLATCANNKPWVSEVHFAYDKNLTIYFRSLPSRRHSQEIAANPAVSGNIITQHFLSMPAVRGVYFEGQATQVDTNDTKELEAAFTAMQDRFAIPRPVLEQAHDPEADQMYKITVEKFYLFDSYSTKPSQKFELEWGK